jgi:hypothetical protein
MGFLKSRLVLGLVGLLALLGFSSVSTHQTASFPEVKGTQTAIVATITPVSTLEPIAIPTLSPTYHRGEDIYYPDVTKTPGDIFSDVTATDVCRSGYSSSVRSVSVATKKAVYTEYGILYPPDSGTYEVDHFIPLELGGSNDIKNLWPEPANPTPGFHQKDTVENYLHKQVCNGQMTLGDAQDLIKTDWYSVFLTMGQAVLGVTQIIPTDTIITVKPTVRPTTVPVVVKPTIVPVVNASGATALCVDGTLSYSATHRGTCSHHGGVSVWYK